METTYNFLLDLALILLTTKILGLVTRRYNMPQVVGALLAGLLMGPACLNILHETTFIHDAAEIGVVVLMFCAGMETDIDELKKSGKASAEEEHGTAVTPLSQIEDAIISIINDNENKGKITYLGELGSRLNDRFTDFDVRNYGYTKLMVFLKDTCQRLFLYQLDSAWAVGLNDQLDREKLEQEIREFIRKSGGQVDNLSLIYEEIHKKHSTFDIKDYGYSRLSSFLKSIRSLSVNGNTVRIREKK